VSNLDLTDTGSGAIVHQRVDRQHRKRAALAIAALIVACTGVGAALGAGTHPSSSAEFRSVSVLEVKASTPALQSVAWHTLGQTLTLPLVRAEIAKLAGQELSALRVGIGGDSESSLVPVYAYATSPTQADALANATASVAVNFLRKPAYASSITRSTFDSSTDGWDVGAGIFVVPASHIAQTNLLAHSGSGSLEVTCLTAGCGPYLVLARTFLRGTTYKASGWVKAPPGIRMRLVLGSTSQDVAVGSTASGTTRWRQFSVEWTPQSEATSAVVTFQVMSRGSSQFNIDDVEVGPRAAVKPGATPPTVTSKTSEAQYSVVTPASVSATLDSNDTAVWATGGAGAGLLIGIAAAAAGAAAARRRKPRGTVGQRNAS
jgi:F0F1-type ATP synthase membrane subunit c/vacuolar-type H+-ATPase subunit K